MDFWNDLEGDEVSGTGYTAGGETLTSTELTLATGTMTYDAADVSWISSTITGAMAAVGYFDRGGATTADELMFLSDFVTAASSSGGTFTIEWNASGISRSTTLHDSVTRGMRALILGPQGSGKGHLHNVLTQSPDLPQPGTFEMQSAPPNGYAPRTNTYSSAETSPGAPSNAATGLTPSTGKRSSATPGPKSTAT